MRMKLNDILFYIGSGVLVSTIMITFLAFCENGNFLISLINLIICSDLETVHKPSLGEGWSSQGQRRGE